MASTSPVSPTTWSPDIIKATDDKTLDPNETSQTDYRMVTLKICAIVGLLIALVGAIALISLYGTPSGALTAFCKKVSLITHRAALAIGTTPKTLAWTITTIGASVCTVGFISWWVSCCTPHSRRKANDDESELNPSLTSKKTPLQLAPSGRGISSTTDDESVAYQNEMNPSQAPSPNHQRTRSFVANTTQDNTPTATSTT